ncbi:MobA/MobL family protein [Azospirillum sp. RWY-5-1]|uniref:MobA/MobL family protein n=1 Tax=Azospirillum oleiclasticum TaxID=2735135 RepID=A0ABX2TEL2_9PROT|nr:MobA/MobL family protein [Azospirillum oleiclasticum]NYZ15025.1 MobA/MobL family protein [Azospirillum oleiclasticum]NYZ22787.1 MobA/MobL family protein [Azospirillum oleiclasticum]
MTAVLYHVQFGIVARSAGHSAVKRSAYQACARREDGGGRVYDWRRKRGEWVGGFMLLPDGAPDWATDPARLWREAEAVERRCDAQLARTIEFSIPRTVPSHLREAFARAVLEPLRARGMAMQVDLHCPPASDGEEQPHAHALLTLRAFEGDGFSEKKRQWNAAFTENAGRAMRGLLADQMNAFFEGHGIVSTVDHRRAAAEPEHAPPERNVPRAAWAAWKVDPTSSAAAPVHAVQDVRRLRHQHRAALAMAEAAKAEVAALSREARRRTPGVAPSDRATREERRRRVLAGLIRQHYDTVWMPESVAANVRSVHLDPEQHRAIITLYDGSQFVDYGDQITFHGPITRTAAAEIAAAAARHGWTSVVLTGSREFKDAVALECALLVPPIATDYIMSQHVQRHLQSLSREVNLRADECHFRFHMPTRPDIVGLAASPSKGGPCQIGEPQIHLPSPNKRSYC